MSARIESVGDNLHLIVLAPPIAGFTNFIGVWLHNGKPCFIVDVGPTAVADDLLKALSQLGVDRLDYILLTHIHMDHAGGIGHVAPHFPEARIVCHESAIEHLVDPTRLWAGTLKTLGDTARGYGEAKPAAAGQLMDAASFSTDFIKPLITPGHAPHHVSYQTPPCLFAGECAGVHLRLPTGREYMRPATPPRFFLDTSIRSIDALLATNPDRMCFGHLGMESGGAEFLRMHRAQQLAWSAMLAPLVDGSDDETVVARCLDEVLREDSLLAGLSDLEEREQERERFFLQNSIRGFMGYIRGSR